MQTKKINDHRIITVLIHRDEMEKSSTISEKIPNKSLQIFTKRHNIKRHYFWNKKVYYITFHF